MRTDKLSRRALCELRSFGLSLSVGEYTCTWVRVTSSLIGGQTLNLLSFKYKSNKVYIVNKQRWTPTIIASIRATTKINSDWHFPWTFKANECDIQVNCTIKTDWKSINWMHQLKWMQLHCDKYDHWSELYLDFLDTLKAKQNSL